MLANCCNIHFTYISLIFFSKVFVPLYFLMLTARSFNQNVDLQKFKRFKVQRHIENAIHKLAFALHHVVVVYFNGNAEAW